MTTTGENARRLIRRDDDCPVLVVAQAVLHGVMYPTLCFWLSGKSMGVTGVVPGQQGDFI